MKKIYFLGITMFSATVMARPDIPTLREEITRQVYVPSPAEQQKLTDAEYNAYRRSGLITKARDNKTTTSNKTEEAVNDQAKSPETATASEAKETPKKASVKQRRRPAVTKKTE